MYGTAAKDNVAAGTVADGTFYGTAASDTHTSRRYSEVPGITRYPVLRKRNILIPDYKRCGLYKIC